MLINLSNHPSENWPEEQKQKALELYQEIVDMPFPEVDPNGDEAYVENLVNDYFCKVQEIKNQTLDEIAVHIMGELTFCFALVEKLSVNGIKCIASTTQRVVKDEGNGKVTKVFRFVRFREYKI
jgi:hypothetical protein